MILALLETAWAVSIYGVPTAANALRERIAQDLWWVSLDKRVKIGPWMDGLIAGRRLVLQCQGTRI